MPVSDDFIEYVIDQLSGWGNVTSRKMFGGAGLYRDGKMFGLIADDVFYLKVDDSNRARYVEAGSSAFKPYPDKKMSMSYFDVPPDVFEDVDELEAWAAGSLAIQKGK